MSIVKNSKIPISVKRVFEIFKRDHHYDFPLILFGCRSYMDYFRLNYVDYNVNIK